MLNLFKTKLKIWQLLFCLSAGWIWIAPMGLLTQPAQRQTTGTTELQVRFTVEHPAKTVHGHIVRLNLPAMQWQTGNCQMPAVPIHFHFPVTSMQTGNRNRDSHMLEVLHYPVHKTIAIQIESVHCPTSPAGAYQIQGFMTIAGSSRPFTSQAWLQKQSGQTHRLRGKLSLSLKDYQLEAPSLMFMAIEDQIEIEYSCDFLIQDS